MSKTNPGPGYKDYPDHSVELIPLSGEVQVKALGTIIATSSNTLRVDESRYPPVIYVPRSDVDFYKLTENDHTTYCPFKGEARYWNIQVGDDFLGNAVWGYDTPYDEVAVLKDYVAFYSDKIDAIIVDGVAQ